MLPLVAIQSEVRYRGASSSDNGREGLGSADRVSRQVSCVGEKSVATINAVRSSVVRTTLFVSDATPGSTKSHHEKSEPSGESALGNMSAMPRCR